MSLSTEISAFKLVRTEEEVLQLIEHCKKTKYASIDFETNGVHPSSKLFYPTVLGVSFQPGSAWVIPLGHFDSCFLKDKKWLHILKIFSKGVIENPMITKIAQNFMFEYMIFLKYGYEVKGRMFDTMLGKYLLDENTPNSLEYLIERFLPDMLELKQSGNFDKLPWDKKPLLPLSQYCGGDCDSTFRLAMFFENRLIKGGFYNLFRNMMGMAIRVLAESELTGVNINTPYLEKLVEEYDEKIETCFEKLNNHKVLRRYDTERLKATKKRLITDIKKEIGILERTKPGSIQLKNKEQKLREYSANIFSTKKDKDLLEPFNFNSTNQIRELFFFNEHGFKFKIQKYTIKREGRMKVQTDNPSTDEEVLLTLQHKDKTGFIKNLLEYRGLTKLQSTYIRGMLEKVDDTNKLHGRFLLHGTVTGRLSSRNPNLQNIPRDTTAKAIKEMFIAPKGYVFLQLDYSQAELRVMAAAAGEKTMINWFKTGKDVHLATACKKMRWDYDERKKILDKEDKSNPEFEKTKVERKKAKTINFGIIYGQGADALAESLSEPEKGIIITKQESQKFLNEWFELFPMMRKYIKREHNQLQINGYVKSVFGRKRRLEGIWSNIFAIKSKALRDCINAPIQGAASDYALFSSIIIWEKIKSGEFKTLHQIMTVHDSLIFYVKPKYIHELVPKLSKICANPQTKEYFGFQIDDVTMQVDFEIGINWANLNKYNPQTNYEKLLAE